ncbi:YcxB family protein [Flavobacterium anhuiense]|uniref:YcxB family protein n=1 Tax=Flavobacterium anhuiense TaxID=459526 RepID=UPI00119D5318|nr:YcxB family protein [Flavobacterium anhuiense]
MKENFKNRIGVASKLLFKEDVLEAFSKDIGSSELNFSGFENISEIKDYFFIALKTGLSIMIPKSEVKNIEALRDELKMITEKKGISFISEFDWKWK